MNKVAIVLGATGLVGRALVEQLSLNPSFNQIISITRRPVAYCDQKVVNHVVDFEDLDQHSATVQGDVLFSCLGTTLKQAGSIEAQRKVDLDYQYKIAQLAVANGVAHYVLVSSGSANSNSKNAYLKMKGELEERIASLPFTKIAIVQPSLLLGRRESLRIGETIGSWILPAITSLPLLKKYRPITESKVAEKMINISLHQEDAFERFEFNQLFELKYD